MKRRTKNFLAADCVFGSQYVPQTLLERLLRNQAISSIDVINFLPVNVIGNMLLWN